MPTMLEELTRTSAPRVTSKGRMVVVADIIGVLDRLPPKTPQGQVSTAGAAVLRFIKRRREVAQLDIWRGLRVFDSFSSFVCAMRRLERDGHIVPIGRGKGKRWRLA